VTDIGCDPYVEWNEGASRLKASRGSDGNQVGGGRRGAIEGFSVESRRRLMFKIACVERDARLPLFITQTFPGEFPSVQEAKWELKLFHERLKYSFPSAGLIWKIEPQDRGAAHFHSLAWGVGLDEMMEWVPKAWYEIAGQGDIKHLNFHQGKYSPYRHCVEQVRSFRGVWAYASKYLGKTFEVGSWKGVGRYWGIINRENIPFGILRVETVRVKVLNDVLRYQRRFAHLRAFGRGMTIFCDADQWVERLKITP